MGTATTFMNGAAIQRVRYSRGVTQGEFSCAITPGQVNSFRMTSRLGAAFGSAATVKPCAAKRVRVPT